MKKQLILVCLAAVMIIGPPDELYAGNRSGVVTAQFLKLPINARATAMGNVQSPLAEGALSIPFNSAGILFVDNVAFGATYNQWWADISHSFVGAAVNLDDIGSIGVGMIALSTDEMIVRTPAFPEGTGEKFRAVEMAYVLSYARRISLDFGIGVTAKYVQSNLYNKEIGAKTVAFDIGTLYDVNVLRTRLGISINNLGQDLTYLNETYSLPSVLRFGVRTTIFEEEGSKLYGVFQISRPNDADEQYNLGAEYTVMNAVSFRAGYKFNYDVENWSGGIGVNLDPLGLRGHFDYAFTNYTTLPGTHMFSLELGF